ncbi:unnamed protein product [Miscanthus lutarioriparius]|uniref:Uncharacterized protein n=1 Tax=Miscanthus lutarioriparius TaxID=422564 RepID=A0A811PKV9_9POAL|nr:unnamed protein product [Miscanthus lutarioriparius]
MATPRSPSPRGDALLDSAPLLGGVGRRRGGALRRPSLRGAARLLRRGGSRRCWCGRPRRSSWRSGRRTGPTPAPWWRSTSSGTSPSSSSLPSCSCSATTRVPPCRSASGSLGTPPSASSTWSASPSSIVCDTASAAGRQFPPTRRVEVVHRPPPAMTTTESTAPVVEVATASVMGNNISRGDCDC